MNIGSSPTEICLIIKQHYKETAQKRTTNN